MQTSPASGRGDASRPLFHQTFSLPAEHFIANCWVAPATGATLPMIDPSEGRPFAAIAAGTAADIDVAVRAARGAYDGAWGRLAPAEKGRLLGRLARAVLDHGDELALIEARDCGKPLAQARNDVAACARYFEFYGGACDKLHGSPAHFSPSRSPSRGIGWPKCARPDSWTTSSSVSTGTAI